MEWFSPLGLGNIPNNSKCWIKEDRKRIRRRPGRGILKKDPEEDPGRRPGRDRDMNNPPPPVSEDEVEHLTTTPVIPDAYGQPSLPLAIESVEAAIRAERERVQNEANHAGGPNAAPVARELTNAVRCGLQPFQIGHLTLWNSQVATGDGKSVTWKTCAEMKGKLHASETNNYEQSCAMAHTLWNRMSSQEQKREAENQKRRVVNFQGGSSSVVGNNNGIEQQQLTAPTIVKQQQP
ncbi:hypothetical protein Tco_0581514 [Tanacetum coccineum]